jgi:hypothetical protein
MPVLAAATRQTLLDLLDHLVLCDTFGGRTLLLGTAVKIPLKRLLWE